MLTGLKLKTNMPVGIASAGGLTTYPNGIIKQANIITNNISGLTQQTSLSNNDIDVLSTHTLKTNRQKFIATTGLNVFRPEILLGTKFESIYDKSDLLLTKHGEMLDIQIAIRNIRMNNLASFVEKLIADETTSSIINDLKFKYTDELTTARNDIRFMIDAYTVIDTVSSRLNIAGNNDVLKRLANEMLDDDAEILDIKSLFIQRLGFSQAGFKAFTNTKIFGQLVFDMCNAVRRYTYKLFDIVDTDRLTDVDPTLYDRTVAKPSNRFTFDISEFGDSENTINAFSPKRFNQFSESMPNSQTDKLKLLAVTLSRLYSTSAALGTRSIQADLRRLNIQGDTDDPFVDMIGVPGITALDEVDDYESVIGLTQIVDPNIGTILPFEHNFIVNRYGKKFTPGDDYFFDALIGTDTFDISRVTNFENIFERRLTSAMNIIEASTRVDTPRCRQQYGSRRHKLTATTIHNNAFKAITDIITIINSGGQRAKNCFFIIAIIVAAQYDKHLKHLLFQTSILATMHMLLSNNTIHFEFIDDIIQNELKTFGSLSALSNFTITVPSSAEVGLFNELNIGELKTVDATSVVISAAYKQLQKLIFDRVFNSLADQTIITTTLIGSAPASFQFDKPTLDQTFDDDFALILTSIAQFTDMLENEAGVHGAIGRLKKRAHLLRNRTGKTRYLNISSSVRYMISFELISTLLKATNIAKFGSLNTAGDTVTVFYADSNKLETLLTLNSLSESQISQSTVVDDNDFKLLFLSVNESLNLDLETIRSMTLNIRALTRTFDDAVDNLIAFFDTKSSKVTRIFGSTKQNVNQPRRIGRRRRNKRIGKRLREYQIEQQLVRRSLLTRQQLALAIIKLNDLSLSNVKASPGREQNTTDTVDIFVDGSRVTTGVKNALFSLMKQPKFRSDGHMKILSVGLPTGMANQLADQVITAQNSSNDKESDIVVINVYMRDVVENDIIFKPQQFIFELSRFVSAWSFNRESTERENFSNIISNFNMFDVSSFEENILTGQKINELINNQRYAFMTHDDIKSMVENHIVSYLLSVYIRMMTSIDVREESFHIIDSANSNIDDSTTMELYTQLVESVIAKSNINISLDDLRERFPVFDDMLTSIEEGELQTGVFEQRAIFDQIASANINVVIAHEIADIIKLSTSRSTLTGGERLRHLITAPKLFERVFNIVVDPFEFIVDIEKTRKTIAGRSAHDRLRRTNVITTSKKGDLLKRMPRGHSIVADQYFITLSQYNVITQQRDTIIQL